MALLTEQQIANFPVAHLSYSALRCYLGDRQSFFKRYIRLEFDMKKGPALIEGDVVHQVLEEYRNVRLLDQENGTDNASKFNRQEAADRKRAKMTLSDDFRLVNWGKTGSAESSEKKIKQALGFYAEELPLVSKVISVEQKFLTEFEDLDNEKMPVPIKCFSDLLRQDSFGDYWIDDHKLVTSITEQEEFSAPFEIQAAANWLCVREHIGVNPKGMIFRQIKASKNKDGSPQIVPYYVTFTPAIINNFIALYKRIVEELAGKPLIDEETGVMRFLPNPFAQFGAEESRNDFVSEVEGGITYRLSEFLERKKDMKIEAEAVDL